MKNIFIKENYNDLHGRLNKISPGIKPIWGKMDVSQMLHHLNITMEAPLGKVSLPSEENLIARLLFKSILYNNKSFGKGSRTVKSFVIKNRCNFEEEKTKALENLMDIFNRNIKGPYNPHLVFGILTTEQWGKHFYKHTDHHLKQFNL
jgi:Protein of unknown function (DUF1569)